MEPTYIAERVRDTVNTIFSLYCNSLTGIFVSVVTVIVVLAVVVGIDISLAVLNFLQVPLQYFGFQKLLNGENYAGADIIDEIVSMYADKGCKSVSERDIK